MKSTDNQLSDMSTDNQLSDIIDNFSNANIETSMPSEFLLSVNNSEQINFLQQPQQNKMIDISDFSQMLEMQQNSIAHLNFNQSSGSTQSFINRENLSQMTLTTMAARSRSAELIGGGYNDQDVINTQQINYRPSLNNLQQHLVDVDRRMEIRKNKNSSTQLAPSSNSFNAMASMFMNNGYTNNNTPANGMNSTRA